MDKKEEHGPTSKMAFQILRPFSDGCAARLGRLSLPSRTPVDTPNFIAVTSRGAVPHLTPDTLGRHVQLAGAIFALEDCTWAGTPVVEKAHKTTPPILRVPSSTGANALHTFTALPLDSLAMLAPRRVAAVQPPNGNGRWAMSIFTSTGFQNLTNEDYTFALRAIRPDIAVTMADWTWSGRLPVAKKQLRMAERTEEWTAQFFRRLDEVFAGESTQNETGSEQDCKLPQQQQQQGRPPPPAIFVPILPLELPMQWEYLSELENSFAPRLSGLALLSVDILADLRASLPTLAALPRLDITLTATPHDLLRHVDLGVDLVAVTFLNQVSDAGVAMTFAFPPPSSASSDDAAVDPEPQARLPLGVNLWATEHAYAVTPLVDSCNCYTCRTHHRAFIHHLLNAREMLAWVLLQIHNHHVMTEFFRGVRSALATSTGSSSLLTTSSLSTPANLSTATVASATQCSWKQACTRFALLYETTFPEGTGERPRARGYHFKSEGGDEPINPKAWGKLSNEETGLGHEGKTAGLHEAINSQVLEVEIT